jgi:hypothetical protein
LKPRVRALVPPILLALLLSVLWHDFTPLSRRLPYGTRTVFAVNDPLARVRKVLGSKAFAVWESGAPEGLPQEIARRLKDPGLPVALLLAGVRQGYWVSGGVPDGADYREFRLVALDVALLPLVARVLSRLPDVRRDGDALRVGDQRITIDGDMLWVGDEFSARVLADVAAGRRESAAAISEFADVLLDSLWERADFSAAFLSPKPIFDALTPLAATMDLSAILDRAAFGGAALHGTIDEKGLRLDGLAINRPEQTFLRTCVPVEGAFTLPARLPTPFRYLGLRVDRAERLADVVAGGIFRKDSKRDQLARSVLGATFVRAFLANFGRESAAWIGPAAADQPTDGATVVAFQVKDRPEADRYLVQLRKLLRQDELPGAEPDAIQVGEKKVYYRVDGDLFLVGVSRERIDAFVAAVQAKAPSHEKADASALFGVEGVASAGCVVGYADLKETLQRSPALDRFATLAPRAALSVVPTDGPLRMTARIAFDNPIRPVGARSLTIARAVYLSVAVFYLAAVAFLAALTVRNSVRFARSRKAAATQVRP